MNKLSVIGNIGQTPTTGNLEKGNRPYASLSLGCTVGYGDNKQTQWVDCLLVGREGVYPYLRKGQKCYVDGDLTVEVYNGKAKLKLNVQNLELLGSLEAKNG